MLKYIILLITYFTLPFFKINMFYFILLLFLVFPFLNATIGYISGSRSGFDYILPIVSCILFWSTLFIHFNYTAMSYGIIYGCICLIANLIGAYHKQKFIDSKG